MYNIRGTYGHFNTLQRYLKMCFGLFWQCVIFVIFSKKKKKVIDQ